MALPRQRDLFHMTSLQLLEVESHVIQMIQFSRLDVRVVFGNSTFVLNSNFFISQVVLLRTYHIVVLSLLKCGVLKLNRAPLVWCRESKAITSVKVLLLAHFWSPCLTTHTLYIVD